MPKPNDSQTTTREQLIFDFGEVRFFKLSIDFNQVK